MIAVTELIMNYTELLMLNKHCMSKIKVYSMGALVKWESYRVASIMQAISMISDTRLNLSLKIPIHWSHYFSSLDFNKSQFKCTSNWGKGLGVLTKAWHAYIGFEQKKLKAWGYNFIILSSRHFHYRMTLITLLARLPSPGAIVHGRGFGTIHCHFSNYT